MDIPSTDDLGGALSTTDVILDAIFGFSFKPPVRPPFDSALKLLDESKKPIVSVDIPRHINPLGQVGDIPYPNPISIKARSRPMEKKMRCSIDNHPFVIHRYVKRE